MATFIRPPTATRAGVAIRSRPLVSSRVASASSSKAFRVRLGSSTRPPRASAADDDAAAPAEDAGPTSRSPEELASERRDALRSRAGGMRVKALKACLGHMGRGGSSFFEKSDIVDAVVDGWEERLRGSTRVPLRQIVGMPGNPRAGYVLVTLDLPGDAGFVDFLIDTGATAALISPALRDLLGAHATDGAAIRGLGSMGETVRQKTTVTDVAVGGVPLKGDLNCVVTDLSATGLPSVVGGMLGLEFLSRFETEFDFANKTLAFHAPGTIVSGAVELDDLIEIPLKTHPTGLKLVRCSLNAGAPFDAVVDAGSFFSAANWMAAASGGVAPDSAGVEQSAMTAVGMDGRTMRMATAAFDLEVLGGGGDDANEAKRFVSRYKGQCCVGDLPAFAALGAETSAFMSMGLDVLGRGRTVLDVRNDRLYLTPGDAPEGGYPEPS